MKSTDNTVFVRFLPASSDIQRHHLEDYFGNIGPIKKCSVIRRNNKDSSTTKEGLGYGFVKFVSTEDAQEAAKRTNESTLMVDGKSYRLKVELASNAAAADGNKKRAAPNETKQLKTTRKTPVVSAEPTPAAPEDEDEVLRSRRKRTSRVIVRNVSFYATEKHIQSCMEQHFGPVVEVTLPRVHAPSSSPTAVAHTHRGFAFVTFANVQAAQQAVQPRDTPILLKQRPVAIDYSVSKMQHQQQQKRQTDRKEKESDDEQEDCDVESKHDSESKSDDDDDDQSTSSTDDDDSDNSSDHGSSDSEEEEEDGADVEEDMPPTPKAAPMHDQSVEERKTLFIRNLPFDATRHDLFDLMRTYGHIDSIYLVKDKSTGVAKGTAFCSFQTAESAQRALEDGGSKTNFVTQREGSTDTLAGGLYLRGRRLFVDLAVDKQTAGTLTAEKREDGTKIHGKDRRNLYLKMEGRVANRADGGSSDNLAWESLPESDQLKRQRAFAEKNTKLRSPLFFINPNRLSVRNLAKHVDEAAFKKLLVTATRRGLDTKLVSQEDQVAHWRASGEMTTRDIIRRISETKETSADGNVIPAFEEKNVKKYIPSVFIDRDFTTNKKEKAPSRGFGFVDFQHHVHALACLRELNNNPYYSAEFVAGGKRASEAKRQVKHHKKKNDVPTGEFASEDGRVQLPRLIVDFTVENKAKAKKQAEHRAQQQANLEKQKLERKEKILSGEIAESKEKKKKKSRGKLQREKKRKARQEGDNEATEKDPEVQKQSRPQKEIPKRVKPTKPPKKKRKTDKEDEKFESLVENYRTTRSTTEGMESKKGNDGASSVNSRGKKRWFED